MLIDTQQVVRDLDARIAEETNPIALRNLKTVRDHMVDEIAGEMDGVMSTLSDNPVYVMWGMPEPIVARGRDEVRAGYEEYHRTKIGTHLQYDLTRIVADDKAVITDGIRKSIFPGSAIAAPDGFPVSNHPVEDPRSLYLVVERQITSWPFDAAGRLTGEEGYRVVTEVRELTQAERDEVEWVFAPSSDPSLK